MLDHALKVLEFHELVGIIASHARSEPGKRAVRGMRPYATREEAIRAQALHADALAVLDGEGILPGIEIADVAPTLKRLEPEGAVVNGDELVECRRLLDAVKAALAARDQDAFESRETLNRALDELHPCPALRGDLHRCLEDDGALKDGASDELRRLRKQIRGRETEVQDRLWKLLHREDMAAVMQDTFVTIRNDRFVVPVKREMKARCQGIVHDHSDSGATVFVEPSHVLPLGNELADLRLDERDECVRILTKLSARIRSNQTLFRENLDRLARLDAAFAVAEWGHRAGCSMPVFGTRLRLAEARHPLLVHEFARRGNEEAVVPLDVELDESLAVLAITGSNSGGKTVAMKTVGLLSLMASSGLPVPVEPESEFEFFFPVFADIGDEQSLAENLSTFTGHVANIRTVLETLNECHRRGDEGRQRALVLLDELGAGTDPLEGGALACAVLEELLEFDAFTVLTTHLGVIKNVVHENERMLNAAVRFNIDTLEPEYVLEVGQPGASNAFRIARRLGLPENVLDRAEALLGSDHLHLEHLLSQLEQDQQRISQQERESRTAAHDATRNRDELQRELAELRRERRQLMRDAYQQAAATVDNTRKEMERLIKRLREADPGEDVGAAAREVRQRLVEKERKVESGLKQTEERTPRALNPGKLAVGQRVYVGKLNGDATVESIRPDGKRVTVKAGALTCTVSPKDLAAPKVPSPAPPRSRTHISAPKASPGGGSAEINLIGRTVDEAEPRLETFLDQAALSGRDQVRVVHGVGTGRLQKGVHAVLQRHPLVKGFRLGRDGTDPGGAGATLVELGE